VLEVATRRRTQAPPPHVVLAALVHPDRDPGRPWLHLLDGERRPVVVGAGSPRTVLWTSLWDERPDARVRFDAQPRDGGTDLRWTLLVHPPAPDAATTRRLRRRLDELVNRDLRSTFDQ